MSHLSYFECKVDNKSLKTLCMHSWSMTSELKNLLNHILDKVDKLKCFLGFLWIGVRNLTGNSVHVVHFSELSFKRITWIQSNTINFLNASHSMIYHNQEHFLSYFYSKSGFHFTIFLCFIFMYSNMFSVTHLPSIEILGPPCFETTQVFALISLVH